MDNGRIWVSWDSKLADFPLFSIWHSISCFWVDKNETNLFSRAVVWTPCPPPTLSLKKIIFIDTRSGTRKYVQRDSMIDSFCPDFCDLICSWCSCLTVLMVHMAHTNRFDCGCNSQRSTSNGLESQVEEPSAVAAWHYSKKETWENWENLRKTSKQWKGWLHYALHFCEFAPKAQPSCRELHSEQSRVSFLPGMVKQLQSLAEPGSQVTYESVHSGPQSIGIIQRVYRNCLLLMFLWLLLSWRQQNTLASVLQAAGYLNL